MDNPKGKYDPAANTCLPASQPEGNWPHILAGFQSRLILNPYIQKHIMLKRPFPLSTILFLLLHPSVNGISRTSHQNPHSL